MSIYAGPVFGMARTQFGIIADHLGIPEDERARLLHPRRAIAVSVPSRDPARVNGIKGSSDPLRVWAEPGLAFLDG